MGRIIYTGVDSFWKFNAPSLRVKNGGPSCRKPCSIMRFTTQRSTRSPQLGTKTRPFLFLAGGEAEGSFKTCQSTLFLTRPALRETSTSKPYLLTQKENTQLQPTQAIMSHLQGRKTTDTLVKSTVPRHGLIKTLIPSHVTLNHFSTPHYQITKVVG